MYTATRDCLSDAAIGQLYDVRHLKHHEVPLSQKSCEKYEDKLKELFKPAFLASQTPSRSAQQPSRPVEIPRLRRDCSLEAVVCRTWIPPRSKHHQVPLSQKSFEKYEDKLKELFKPVCFDGQTPSRSAQQTSRPVGISRYGRLTRQSSSCPDLLQQLWGSCSTSSMSTMNSDKEKTSHQAVDNVEENPPTFQPLPSTSSIHLFSTTSFQPQETAPQKKPSIFLRVKASCKNLLSRRKPKDETISWKSEPTSSREQFSTEYFQPLATVPQKKSSFFLRVKASSKNLFPRRKSKTKTSRVKLKRRPEPAQIKSKTNTSRLKTKQKPKPAQKRSRAVILEVPVFNENVLNEIVNAENENEDGNELVQAPTFTENFVNGTAAITDEVVEEAATVVEGATSVIGQIVEGVISATSLVVEGATAVVEGTASVVGQVVEGTASVAGQVVEGAAFVAGQVVEGTASVAGQVVEGTASVAGQVVEGAASVAGQVIEGTAFVAGQVVEGATTVVEGVASAAGQVVEGIASVIQTDTNGFNTDYETGCSPNKIESILRTTDPDMTIDKFSDIASDWIYRTRQQNLDRLTPSAPNAIVGKINDIINQMKVEKDKQRQQSFRGQNTCGEVKPYRLDSTFGACTSYENKSILKPSEPHEIADQLKEIINEIKLKSRQENAVRFSSQLSYAPSVQLSSSDLSESSSEESSSSSSNSSQCDIVIRIRYKDK